eukprot:GHVQ01033093.1.p1 GENE.GHVQ01033093.1~~GHVQ01033093.1.p1  ORF type:complete len:2566 (+),score=376.05 GHVQ01033093.1:821-7699(+)
MSYITAYADQIVKAGGIPLLVELLNNGLNDLATNPAKVYPMIGGCSRMLGRIGQNHANVDLIASCGGVASLSTAVGYCTENLTVLAALCESLVPLAKRESLANEIKDYQTFATVLPILYASVEDVELAKAAMELVSAGSQHPDCQQHMVENTAVEILATCCQYNTDDAVFQLHALNALSCLAGRLSSVSTVYEYGGLAGIAASLAANSKTADVALAGVLLSEKIASVPDAATYMTDGVNVDAVLEAMLAQESNEALVRGGVRTLDQVATESDCGRHLGDLERAMQQAASDPDRVYKTLAAVAGLCRVSHLKGIFEQKRAAEAVLKGVGSWIETNRFESQGIIIQAGIRSAKALKLNTQDELAPFFVNMASVASFPQLKRIVELQEADDNALVDVVSALRAFAASDRIKGEEAIETCVESVLKLMRKFPDSRLLQRTCLETLTYFAASDNGAGLRVMITTGGINAVVSALNKFPVYLDMQIAGFVTLVTCVKIDPDSCVDIILKSGGLDALNTATRMHSKSKELKRTVAPLAALLMPEENLEREIKEKIALVIEAMETMDVGHLHQNLSGLNDLLVTPIASKIAARNNVGDTMKDVQSFILANEAKCLAYSVEDDQLSGDEFYNSCLSESAQVITGTTQSRPGAVHLTKKQLLMTQIQFWEMLMARSQTPTTEEGVVRALDGIRILMKHDRKNADLAFAHGFVGSLCRGLDAYPNSDAVMAATCSCLASMATTPSRVEKLIAQPEFTMLLSKLVTVMATSASRNGTLRAMEALEDLLNTNDPAMTNKIAEAGAAAALFRILHEHPDDKDMAKQAAKCLSLMGRFEDLRRFTDEGDIRQPLESCTAALRFNKTDPDTTCALLDVMNKMTTKEDKATLKEAGCMEIVAEVMGIHAEDSEIVRLGGELFSKMGADEQIKALMLQIINTVESGTEGYPAVVDGLCIKLAVFLAAPVEDADDALQYTEACLTALNLCLEVSPSDGRLIGNVAMVARRLCDRCFDDPEDAYGAWAVASTTHLHAYCALIEDPNSKACSTKKFLVSGYRVLGGICVNPYSRPTILDIGASTYLLPRTFSLLDQHKADHEVGARILEFLSFYAQDEQGCQSIVASTGPQGDCVQSTMAMMMLHKSASAVFVAGSGLLGALAANGGPNAHPDFTSGKVLKDCNSMLGSTSTAAVLIANMTMLENFMLNGYYNDSVKAEGSLGKIVGRIKVEEDEKRFTDAERAGLYGALGRMLVAAAAGGLVAEVEKCKGFDCLTRAIEEQSESVDVIRNANRAFMGLAAADVNMSARCAHEAIPKLAAEASATIQTDPECADSFVDVMLEACNVEGNGRVMLNSVGVDETLQGIEQLAAYYGDEWGENLKQKVARVRQAMLDDTPIEPTCREVYATLNGRKERELSNSIDDSPLLVEKFDFLFTQMGMYGQEKLDHTTAMGEDHQYGNMAIALLSEEKANITPMLEKDVIKMSLHCMKNQTDAHIVDYAVKGLAALIKFPDAAQANAKTSGVTSITTDNLEKIIKSKEHDAVAREAFLIPRLTLIDRAAVNRNLYNKSKVMTHLIALWDQTDKEEYTTDILRYVFRAMRRVVSDAHVDELLKAKALHRLRDLIDKRPTDALLLPDVLFLVGSLGVVPEIKTKIGEIGGILSLVELLRFLLHDETASAVITNCCLALANVCIGHKKNIAIFASAKGQDLNVTVLEVRGASFDISNAASVLLCNLMYKNEDMKKIYGVNGAPKALVECLKKYDGSVEKATLRCVQSLFKAISNLSLYTPNVQQFLDANIEEAYKTILLNAGPQMPDNVLETALRTLSNLVTENEEFYMRKFGICLLPLMGVAKHGRSDPTVIHLMLDIEVCLCRLRENCQAFADNNGIDLTTRMIQQFDYDVSVLTTGIHLLASQSSIPSSIPLLVDADVFSILIGCCEVDAEGNEVTDLVIGGLRCARRIINSPELAQLWCDTGGGSCMKTVICNMTTQPMVALEAFRLTLTLFGFLGGAEGALETMGIEEQMGGAMCQAVCTCLLEESHKKQLRLQRNGLGLCAYFAQQKMATDALVQGNIKGLIVSILTVFCGDRNLLFTACCIIDNIALTSGDLYDTIKSKELVAAVKSSVGKLPSKDAAQKAAKATTELTLKALQSNADPFEAYEGSLVKFDLALTEYNVDPYPNGVQDLPADMKTILRKGGKMKMLGNSDKEQLVWRASQDLHAFEWLIGAEKEFSNRLPITRVKQIGKGLCNEALKAGHKKESRKVTQAVSLCLFGPASEEHPSGLALNLLTKNAKERNAFVEMVVTWRDAATYSL